MKNYPQVKCEIAVPKKVLYILTLPFCFTHFIHCACKQKLMFMLITFIIAQMKNRCLALKRKTFNKAYRVALLFADKRYIAFSFWCGIDHVPKPVQIPDFGVAFD